MAIAVGRASPERHHRQLAQEVDTEDAVVSVGQGHLVGRGEVIATMRPCAAVEFDTRR